MNQTENTPTKEKVVKASAVLEAAQTFTKRLTDRLDQLAFLLMIDTTRYNKTVVDEECAYSDWFEISARMNLVYREIDDLKDESAFCVNLLRKLAGADVPDGSTPF